MIILPVWKMAELYDRYKAPEGSFICINNINSIHGTIPERKKGK